MTDRLVIVHGLYPKKLFGAARYLIDLAKLQSEAGHEVHVIGCPEAEMTRAFVPAVTVHELGFLLSAGATVALISAYAGWVFDSRRQGWTAVVAFTALYALIYVLMRLEDYALLVGALSSFAAIAAVMYFTRKVDWYGIAGNDSRDIA